VTGQQVVAFWQPAHDDLAFLHALSLDQLIEDAAEDVAADHADDQFMGSVRRRRPLHELGEVVQECRLDLAFVEAALRLGRYRHRQQHRHDECGHGQRAADQSHGIDHSIITAVKHDPGQTRRAFAENPSKMRDAGGCV